MMAQSTDWVFENSETRGSERLVLLCIASEFDTHYGAAPKFDLARIARRAGLSEYHARHAVDALNESGRIVLAHGIVYLTRVP
jgi:AraC-like DNA-binding protein